MSIAVQIVHYRTPTLLENCLRSLHDQQVELPLKIYVLDNASGHRVAAELRILRRRWVDVTFVSSLENVGYGAGHNRLLEVATPSTFTLLVNPSVQFHTPNDLQRLIDFMQQTAACGVVGPQLVNARGGRQRYDHAELFGWRAWLLGFTSHRFSKLHTRVTQVAWVSGAALLIRTDVFLQLGGFDPQFFLYREEEDLLHRLRTITSWKVWYHPKVIATHVEHASGGGSYLYMAPSFRLFCSKHHHRYNPAPRMYELIMKLCGVWKWGT